MMCARQAGNLWFSSPLFLSGKAFALDSLVRAIPVFFHSAVAKAIGATPLYGLTHPLGALIMSWMILRSTIVTLWRGSVTWRDTFYPLEDLRKGVVQRRMPSPVPEIIPRS